MITASNIQKTFGEQTVLSNLSFNIEEKQIFGLLGPSGSGKTTIINILTNQTEVDTGTISVNANPFEIGLMLDEDGLYPRLSCLENLNVFARIYKTPAGSAEQALEDVGLADAAKKPVTSLSKGMRQRLALARAILHKPKILFLDEPTSALDPRTTDNMHGLIQNLRDKGSTIFLTTHNMDEAVKLCDHVALLYKGSIVEQGEPLDICNRHNSMRTVPDLGSVFMKMTGADLNN